MPSQGGACLLLYLRPESVDIDQEWQKKEEDDQSPNRDGTNFEVTLDCRGFSLVFRAQKPGNPFNLLRHHDGESSTRQNKKQLAKVLEVAGEQVESLSLRVDLFGRSHALASGNATGGTQLAGAVEFQDLTLATSETKGIQHVSGS
jgi:hypothetical protein